MATPDSDADALRRELETVKEKAKAYISKLTEEKNLLSKELQEKTSVLAGVKEKTKAYVEKLNGEKAAAVAALEEQVRDRDDRLSRAKDLLQARLAAKDEELEISKKEAQTLREQMDQQEDGAHDMLKANGDASAAPKSSEEAPGEELQRATEALAASEAARSKGQAALAESMQAKAKACESLAVAARERSMALAELSASQELVASLKTSLVEAQDEAEAAKSQAASARDEALQKVESVRSEAAIAAEATAERHQVELSALEARLKQSQESSAARIAELEATEEDLRSRLGGTKASVLTVEASAEAFAKDPADAEAEMARLREDLRKSSEKLNVMEKERCQAVADATSLQAELHDCKERLRVAREASRVNEGSGGQAAKEQPNGREIRADVPGEPEANLSMSQRSEAEELVEAGAEGEVRGARGGEASESASCRIASLEDELARCKLMLHEAEEKLAGAETAAKQAIGEVARAREGAGNQAEELSARLMEALEEREEGAREIARLKAEAVEAREAVGKAKEEVATSGAVAESQAAEWVEKVKEAEDRVNEAEVAAVGVVKSLQDALTEREGDVKRLEDEATGLRKEVSMANAELEAKGVALQQAKLDLASAVEEASVAGGRAAEALAKLDATEVELSDVKIRLQSETAANVGLKAAVMEANETVSKRVDGMRESIERAEAERDAARVDAATGKSQAQALQAQVASLLREHEGAKTVAGLKAGELQQRLSLAEVTLSKERETFAEEKREMQVYADAMAKEGDAMRAAVQDAQVAAARALASEEEAASSLAKVDKRAETSNQSLRQELEKHTSEATQQIAKLQQANKTLESEKARLEQVLIMESDQREEKTQGLEHDLMGKIEEANLHKKKRLAARSEMISLAKTLEMERDGHKTVGHALQYGLVPKAIEQATMLENLVMTSERAVYSLSRASGVRLATNIQAAQATLARLRGRVASADATGASLHQRQCSDLARVALMGGNSTGGPEDATGSVLSDRLESPLGSAASSDQTGPGFWLGAPTLRSSGKQGSDQGPAKDSVYMERVRRLESEMDRVTSGLALVSQSVDQLSELVQVQAGLCAGFSVLCCRSRRPPSASRGGRGGGPAYTTLEMENRHNNVDDDNRERGIPRGLIRR